jgi:hypothetical protein
MNPVLVDGTDPSIAVLWDDHTNPGIFFGKYRMSTRVPGLTFCVFGLPNFVKQIRLQRTDTSNTTAAVR